MSQPRSIDRYLDELRRELRVGSRLKSRILHEVETHLAEGVEREQASRAPEEIEREVVERFGPPRTIAGWFVADLASSAARAASGAVALTLVGIAVVGSIVAGMSPPVPYGPWPEPVETVRGVFGWASLVAFAATALALLLTFRHGGGASTIPRKELRIIVPATIFAFGATVIDVFACALISFWGANRSTEAIFDSPPMLALLIGGTAGALVISAVFVVRAVVRLVALERATRDTEGARNANDPSPRSLRPLGALALAGAATLVVLPGLTSALGSSDALDRRIVEGGQEGILMPIRWKAASSTTHSGDRYSLVVKNTGEEDQRARVRSMIVDSGTRTKTTAVDERVKLAPGEEQEFTAVNDYGTADRFRTVLRSETQDLALSVQVTDAAGMETSRLDEEAFLIQEKEQKGQQQS